MDDSVEGYVEGSMERDLSLSGESRVSFEGDKSCGKSGACADPPQESVSLSETADLPHDTGIHQPEITGIPWNGDISDLFQKPVKERGTLQIEEALSLSRGALCDDYFEALFPLSHHLFDELRRVLKVRIDDHDRRTPGVFQSGNE